MRLPSVDRLALASRLLLATCALLASGAARGQAHGNSHSFKALRPRLGYFSRYEPSGAYMKIYEDYFANVIARNDESLKALPVDDWRRVRPMGELCVDFLVGMEVKEFVMSKPYELIVLDACLDWLFDRSDPVREKERQADVEQLDKSRRQTLEALGGNAQLRQIYEGTRMRDEHNLPAALLGQIREYLDRLLRIYYDNPRNGCHSHWLEAYNDFVEDVYVGDCDDETDCNFFGLQDGHQDPYLRLLVESTRQASKRCYEVIQKQISGLVEDEFERSSCGSGSLRKCFINRMRPVERQSEREKWSRELISILQLVSGLSPEKPVNLGEAAADLYQLKNGDEKLVGRFTKALNEYATRNDDSDALTADGMGRERFGRVMIKLCQPYTDKRRFLTMTGGINTDEDEYSRKPFDFYGLVYSLVRLTNHESLFELTKDAFEEDVIRNHWEALYLATFACQLISTAWGELDYNSNAKSFYVRMRPRWQLMVADWPIEVLHEKLPQLYSKEAKARSGDSGDRPTAFFGKKFKGSWRSKKQGNEGKQATQQAGPAQAQEPAPEPAPVPAPMPAVGPSASAAPAEAPKQLGSQEPPSGQPEHSRPQVASSDTIKMFHQLPGRLQKVPNYYNKIYPEPPKLIPSDRAPEPAAQSGARDRLGGSSLRGSASPSDRPYGNMGGSHGGLSEGSNEFWGLGGFGAFGNAARGGASSGFGGASSGFSGASSGFGGASSGFSGASGGFGRAADGFARQLPRSPVRGVAPVVNSYSLNF